MLHYSLAATLTPESHCNVSFTRLRPHCSIVIYPGLFFMTPQQMQALISQSFTLQPLSRAEKATLAEQLAAGLPDAAEISVLRSQLFRQAEAAINGQNMNEILRWLEDMMRLLERFDDAKSSGTVEAWFSPKADCPGRIRSFLAQAKSTVDICVFTITDDRLTSAVLEAHARGVKIRIITDNDKAADLGSDAERFLQAGVQLRVDRTPYHMHHKFAIADRSLLLNGSYNWTRGAAESNEENFVITDDKKLLAAFSSAFEELWEEIKGG